MTNSSRSNMIHLLAFTVLALVFVPTSKAEQLAPAAEEMAKAYGLHSWGQIQGIRYTWNAEFAGSVKPLDGGSGTIKVSRTWECDPKTGTVSYEGKDKNGQPVEGYLSQRSQVGSENEVVRNQVDPNFFNDQYWLLFPLRVAWDSSADVTDEGMHKLPLGAGSAEKIVVKYPSEGGYLPGDNLGTLRRHRPSG
jgi:hypothetical protein